MENDTELKIFKSNYLVHNTIIIRNKNNITIGPLDGQVQLNGQGIHKLLSIIDSNNITISQFKIFNSTYTLELINSSYIKINDNEIEFIFPGDGVTIIGGKNNSLYGNTIRNISDSCNSKETSVGIKLINTSNNKVERNEIFTANPGWICSYAILNSVNKHNIIKFFRMSEPFIILQDKYLGTWNKSISDFDCMDNYGDCETDCLCRIHDMLDDPMEWEP